jgi:hypothetical protein
MSRLTGNDAKGLMEAYQAVYAPKELTEEEVWEEVENWVNSLVDEGYDLSEYTWEEMYEHYSQLDEAIPLAIPPAMAAAPYVLPALGAAAYGLKGLMNRGKTKNTPEEERFLNTGSFAASKEAERRGKEAAELNRKQNQPAQPASTPVSGRTIRGERPRIRVAATRPQGSTTSTPGASVQQPKPPEKQPEPSAKDLGGEITRQSTTPGQSSASSSTSAPSGGSGASGGGRQPKPEGPNWAQRQLTNMQRGRTQEKGAGTAERLGRVIGSGEKIAKGGAEWAAKNLIAKPLGALAGGSIIGGAGYGAYKGSEELIKTFGPGVVKKGKEILNRTTSNPPRPRRGTPPKIEDVKEKVDPIEIYNRQGNLQKVTPGKGYGITKGGKRGYVVYDTSGKPKFTEYPTQPTPAAQSPAPKPSTDPGAKQPGESLRDYAIRTEREASQAQPPAATTTPAPAPAPSQQPPAATTTPAPAPAPRAQVPTEPSKVSPSKPAQTGDRTKDLTTWALANKTMINKVGTPQQKAILSAADKGTAMPAPRPISKDVEDIRKMQAASRERQGVKESYDAYDLVLEYLLSQGHVESLDEALYVMMEMDAEMIGDIVEGYQELNYKRRNRMTDQAMRHMNKGDDASWEKAYRIENERDTQTPEVSKAKAAANKKRGPAKRG